MARLWIAALTLLLAPRLGAADLWVHCDVTRASGERTVVLTLPLRAVERVIPSVIDGDENSRLLIGDEEITPSEIRDWMMQLASRPDGAELDVLSGETHLRLVRNAGILKVRPVESGPDAAAISVPVWLAEALLSGDEWSFNLSAALVALRAHDGGELTLVEDSGDRTHIWVNRRSDTEEKP